jgi:hypothetical protein
LYKVDIDNEKCHQRVLWKRSQLLKIKSKAMRLSIIHTAKDNSIQSPGTFAHGSINVNPLLMLGIIINNDNNTKEETMEQNSGLRSDTLIHFYKFK